MKPATAAHVPAPLKGMVAQAIDSLCAGCAVDSHPYRRYLERTCWRVAADFAFLRKQVPTSASVLDAGAVPPLLVALLAQAGHRQLTVVDPHASAFTPWFEAHGVHHIDTDLIQDTRLLPDPCDLVCLCEVIEHLTGDLVPVFARLSRWVAPDGYLYVTTPNLRSISGLAGLVRHGSGLASKCHETVRQQYERAEGEGGYFGHVREYTAKEVVDFICSFGFGHVASAYQFHPRAETLDRKLIQAMERMLPPWRLFGKHLFRKTG